MLRRLGASHQAIKEFGHRYRKTIVYTAFAAFLLGLYYTANALSLNLNDLDAKPFLIIVFFTQPLLILFSSIEYTLCGRAVDVEMSLRDSMYITLSASLANILPLPAGLLVRGGYLVQQGGKLGEVSRILLIAGTMWLAVAMTVSGAVISEPSISRIATILGAGMVLVLMAYVTYLNQLRIALGFFLVRVVMVAIFALQLKLCFAILGEVISFRASAVYVVSGIAGAVISIVPAGLGLTEAFGAFLAKLDGASPAFAYIVLSLNRFIGIAIVGLAFFLFVKKKSDFGRKLGNEKLDG